MVETLKDKASFEAAKQKANKEGKYMLVDFTAQWCGPCKMISPKLEELSKVTEYAVLVYKVDVDEAEDVAAECNISAMPTFILFDKDGKEVEPRVQGANQDKLKALFEKTK